MAMSAEQDRNAWTKLEDLECKITKVKQEETIDERAFSEKTDLTTGNPTMKRKRSKAPPGKPPYSYVALITMAITSSPRQKMTLSEIHKFIADNFAYYRICPLKWRNAVRHNLTLNDCFVKLPRECHDQNRGHYWTVDPASELMFEDGSYRRRKRKFTRREDLHQTLPLLVERTNVARYEDETPQLVPSIPYPPRVPVINHMFPMNQRRGFTIDDILAPRPVVTTTVPAFLNYPPTTSPRMVNPNRYLGNTIPSRPQFYWSSPPSYTYQSTPERTFCTTPQ